MNSKELKAVAAVIGVIAAVYALCVYLVTVTHCIVEYNGGRAAQCTYEIFYKQTPNN